MIVTCKAASTKCIVKYDSFSKKNLRKLSEDIRLKDISVLRNFQPDAQIGRVINSYVEGNYLHILVQIAEIIDPTYITPAFKIIEIDYEANTDKFIYKDIELLSFGTTTEPADIGLTKFRVIKW